MSLQGPSIDPGLRKNDGQGTGQVHQTRGVCNGLNISMFTSHSALHQQCRMQNEHGNVKVGGLPGLESEGAFTFSSLVDMIMHGLSACYPGSKKIVTKVALLC